MKNKLIIYTDLDSTLLNDNYSWGEASEALAEINNLQIPLILNSSKTISEIKNIRSDLGLYDAIIAENGSVIGIPRNILHPNKNSDHLFISYDENVNRYNILNTIHSLRNNNNFLFEGFFDWSLENVIKNTGLSEHDAYNSMNRYMTEPILWLDTDDRFNLFLKLIKSEGLQCISGGRFKHIMHSCFDKGSALLRVLAMYKQADPTINYKTVALGDSPNDLPMLKNADYAILIKNNSNLSMKLNHTNLRKSNYLGPIGWNEEVLKLLQEYYPERIGV